jgi:hypothetical protein
VAGAKHQKLDPQKIEEQIQFLKDQEVPVPKRLEELLSKAKETRVEGEQDDLKKISGKLNAAENHAKQLATSHNSLLEKLALSEKALHEAAVQVEMLTILRDKKIKDDLGMVKAEDAIAPLPPPPPGMEEEHKVQYDDLVGQATQAAANFKEFQASVQEGFRQLCLAVQQTQAKPQEKDKPAEVETTGTMEVTEQEAKGPGPGQCPDLASASNPRRQAQLSRRQARRQKQADTDGNFKRGLEPNLSDFSDDDPEKALLSTNASERVEKLLQQAKVAKAAATS